MNLYIRLKKQDFTETIQEMLGLHDKVIDKDLHMYYEGNMVRLHRGHCGWIKPFKAYYIHCITDLHCIFDNELDW